MTDPTFEPIERAWTPSSKLYTDPGTYSEVLEKVFARSWQWVGDDRLVKAPGQVSPLTLLEGSLDEPIVLTRDTQDALHCLSNVCTHRGMLVCEAGGNERFLRCRYHGRRFGLDGRFQDMPEFEAAENFPSESDHLSRVPMARWRSHLFAGVAPAIGFEEWISPVQERVSWMPIESFFHEPSRQKDYFVSANWALYVDNYLEGFHIPFIHNALAGTLDYGNYRTELFAGGNLQLGVAKAGEPCFDLPPDSPDFGERIGAYYFWLFPNLMLNFYPWGLSINVVKPLGPSKTKVSFIQYVGDPSKLDDGAGSGLDRVEREDEAVVEAVQRGLRSRFYDRGRYSPTRETGTHQFHQLLLRSLASSESGR